MPDQDQDVLKTDDAVFHTDHAEMPCVHVMDPTSGFDPLMGSPPYPRDELSV